jgi:hypothetical protein
MLICLWAAYWGVWILIHQLPGHRIVLPDDFLSIDNRMPWLFPSGSFLVAGLSLAGAVSLWWMRPVAFFFFVACLAVCAADVAVIIIFMERTTLWIMEVLLPNLFGLGIQASICVYIWRVTALARLERAQA